MTELTATDSIELSRPAVQPQFNTLLSMPDEKYVFANVSEIGAFDEQEGTYATLSAISLLDGTITPILRGRAVVDWYFISRDGPDIVSFTKP